MNSYSHIKINEIQGDIKRKKHGGGKYDHKNRNKSSYVANTKSNANSVIRTFNNLKERFKGIITPSLIFELEINQSVDPKAIEKILSSMDIEILSYAENKQGYWVVFSSDENLAIFKRKLEEYGSEDGRKYDFFDAFENLTDIPKEEKIGNNLKSHPLSDAANFVDIELWRMTDVDKNHNFIDELKQAFPDFSTFRITDTLITKSFVLLRVKLTKAIFDEIIELKEIARIDRPFIPDFNPYEFRNIDVNEYDFNAPEDSASGILVIDSGITSNHPFLEKCVGDEANFQTGESETNDTVGHGTAVAGCAVYGDLEEQMQDKILSPSNWLFSAKIMYAEKNPYTGEIINAKYDSEKLVENQLKEAIEYFFNNSLYKINVVNLSIGDSYSVWHKDYFRQLPLASLIDEIAFALPDVTFIVSAGNQNPLNVFDDRTEVSENYPSYFVERNEFNIINPATSALALTVGSIAQKVRVRKERYGVEDIKLVIAEENYPSPFTRTGPGINKMIKPEIVEYGGNQIFTKHNLEDVGGKLLLLNNTTTDKLMKFDIGTSFNSKNFQFIW
jgi:hypothetical protein